MTVSALTALYGGGGASAEEHCYGGRSFSVFRTQNSATVKASRSRRKASMQILFINQFFWPDTAATGQLLTDVAREIDPKAHVVTVLCGTSVYGAVDKASAPRVNIVRLGGVTFSRGKVGRVISYASFFTRAALRGIRGPKPALVLTLTTPPLISLLGTLLRWIRGSRHFIWEM